MFVVCNTGHSTMPHIWSNRGNSKCGGYTTASVAARLHEAHHVVEVVCQLFGQVDGRGVEVGLVDTAACEVTRQQYHLCLVGSGTARTCNRLRTPALCVSGTCAPGQETHLTFAVAAMV